MFLSDLQLGDKKVTLNHLASFLGAVPRLVFSDGSLQSFRAQSKRALRRLLDRQAISGEDHWTSRHSTVGYTYMSLGLLGYPDPYKRQPRWW